MKECIHNKGSDKGYMSARATIKHLVNTHGGPGCRPRVARAVSRGLGTRGIGYIFGRGGRARSFWGRFVRLPAGRTDLRRQPYVPVIRWENSNTALS